MEIALFLVDERMPEMAGTDMLQRALKVYPDARRVLLTAYADTDTAITGINELRLDHYLMKPWEPPAERLYPVLDELLDEWATNYRPPFEGIRVVGTSLSRASHGIKDFLFRNQVQYQWVDIDTDPAAKELVAPMCDGFRRLPVVLFPDGSSMVAPSERELAERLGMHTRPTQPSCDLVVLGGGPAGLGASVYASSEGLSTVLVEQFATGGQAGTSSRIENYLGFPNGLSGADLARRATTQATRFGTEILTPQEVKRITRNDPARIVELSDGTEINARAVLIASGMEVRRLETPGVDRLNGAGVFYGAAMTEANTYRGQPVVVVGGGNSAGQGAMFLSRYAREVTIVVRRDLVHTMSKYLIDRIHETPNTEVVSCTVIEEALGEKRLEAVRLRNVESGEITELPVAAMFIFIGTAPRTGMVKGFVEMDDRGFILTGPDLVTGGQRPKGWQLDRDPYFFETSVPGVFAAGDVRRGSPKRVASAVGEGAATISMVHEYLAST